MTTYKPGDIVLVKFPFTNLETTKQRPALVIHQTIHSPKKIDLICIAMITSQLEGYRLEGDIRLEKWEEAGLLHSSIIRLSKVTTLDSDLVNRKLGALLKHDLLTTKKEFQKLFHFWM